MQVSATAQLGQILYERAFLYFMTLRFHEIFMYFSYFDNAKIEETTDL